ncbi:GAF domain-containing protein [Romeriopsis navalis]|nr:GAF domain-containing protein [Romeriopsis navalis]
MQFDPNARAPQPSSEVSRISTILQRLNQNMQRDDLVQKTTDQLRNLLQVDRVVLYYFYKQWNGQVTFESLSDPQYSIYGSSGPDECFVDAYAEMYLAGRVRAIENIETAEIHDCHRDFLRDLQVQANLVVPILTSKRLWGLLVAHHCDSPRSWLDTDIHQMQTAAKTLAAADSIRQER